MNKLNQLNQILPNNINNQHIPIEIISHIKEYIPKPLTNENIKQIIKYYFTYDPDELNKKKEKEDLIEKHKKEMFDLEERHNVIKRYGKIDNWDVSQVTDMNSLFVVHLLNPEYDDYHSSNDIYEYNYLDTSYLRNFNEDISKWNVSNVTNMKHMFHGATLFNQPLNNWDVSQVIDMRCMFCEARTFNQPLNNWNVSNVTDMGGMFSNATKFNQPLNNWNVSNVNRSMWCLFHQAESFNQSLNDWNVSKVTNMCHMFSKATSFNQPLNNWNVSNVINMNNMFDQAEAFNQPLNNWNVSSVTTMELMFTGFSCNIEENAPWYL